MSLSARRQSKSFHFIVGVLAHIRPIFDTITGLSYELDEEQYSEHEACDPWVQHLLIELEEVCKKTFFLLPSWIDIVFTFSCLVAWTWLIEDFPVIAVRTTNAVHFACMIP